MEKFSLELQCPLPKTVPMLHVDILLIDDDEEEFVILMDAVKPLPTLARCVHANSAANALLMLEKIQARFILVDMEMPLIKGLECIKMLIKANHNEFAQVIMYSIHMNDKLCAQTMEAGGNGCLKKPLTIPELTILIESLFKKGKV